MEACCCSFALLQSCESRKHPCSCLWVCIPAGYAWVCMGLHPCSCLWVCMSCCSSTTSSPRNTFQTHMRSLTHAHPTLQAPSPRNPLSNSKHPLAFLHGQRPTHSCALQMACGARCARCACCGARRLFVPPALLCLAAAQVGWRAVGLAADWALLWATQAQARWVQLLAGAVRDSNKEAAAFWCWWAQCGGPPCRGTARPP